MFDISKIKQHYIKLIIKNKNLEKYHSYITKDMGFIWFILALASKNRKALIFPRPMSISPFYLIPFFSEIYIYEDNEHLKSCLLKTISDKLLPIKVIGKKELLKNNSQFKEHFQLIAYEHDRNTTRTLKKSDISRFINFSLTPEGQFISINEYPTSLPLWKEWLLSKPKVPLSQFLANAISLISLPRINYWQSELSVFTQKQNHYLFNLAPTLSKPDELKCIKKIGSEKSIFQKYKYKLPFEFLKKEALVFGNLPEEAFINIILKKIQEKTHNSEITIQKFLIRSTGVLVIILGKADIMLYVARIPLYENARLKLEKSWFITNNLHFGKNYISRWLPRPILKTECFSYQIYVESFIDGIHIGDYIDQNNPDFLLESNIFDKLYEINPQSILISDNKFHHLITRKIDAICINFHKNRKAFDKLEQYIKEFALNQTLTLTFCHGDLNPGNIKCSAISGKIKGLIDWDSYSDENFVFIDILHFLISLIKEEKKIDFGVAIVDILENGIENKDYRNILENFSNKHNLNTNCLNEYLILYWIHRVFLHCVDEHQNVEQSWIQKNVHYPLKKITENIEKHEC